MLKIGAFFIGLFMVFSANAQEINKNLQDLKKHPPEIPPSHNTLISNTAPNSIGQMQSEDMQIELQTINKMLSMREQQIMNRESAWHSYVAPLLTKKGH